MSRHDLRTPNLRFYRTADEAFKTATYADPIERPLRVPTFRRRNVLANLSLAVALWAAIGFTLVLIFGGR